jgi:hypothetical protein
MEQALMECHTPPVSSVMTTVVEALRVVWRCADVSSDFSLPIECGCSPVNHQAVKEMKEVSPSLAELKWMKDELNAMQTALWSHLTSHPSCASLDPFTLCRLLPPLQSTVQSAMHRFKAALSFDPATASRASSVVDPRLSSLSSLSLVDHQLRSCRARLHLASQRPPSSTAPLLTDLDFIQRLINDVSTTCKEMEQHLNRSAASQMEEKEEPPPSLINSATDDEKRGTDDSGTDQCALMNEMQGLRRRREEQADGEGLVFEGEGQHHPHPPLHADSFSPKPFKPQPTPTPSPFALTLSMVTELKSVLSHRTPVPFHALSE